MIVKRATKRFTAVETTVAISASTVVTFTPREHSIRSFWRFTCLLDAICNKSCATNSAITPSAMDVRVNITVAEFSAVKTEVIA